MQSLPVLDSGACRADLTHSDDQKPILHVMADVPLWLLIGLPGSGKSTWARRLASGKLPLLIISTDQIRAQLYGDEATQGNWLEIWSQVQNRLRYGVRETQQGRLGGVLYDATNTRRRSRHEILQAARKAGFNKVFAVWIDAPLACCLYRNRMRSRRVPPDIIHSMARQLVGAPPHCDEGFDALFHLRS